MNLRPCCNPVFNALTFRLLEFLPGTMPMVKYSQVFVRHQTFDMSRMRFIREFLKIGFTYTERKLNLRLNKSHCEITGFVTRTFDIKFMQGFLYLTTKQVLYLNLIIPYSTSLQIYKTDSIKRITFLEKCNSICLH